MEFLRCTFVTDGSSDRQLIPILEWVLRNVGKVPSISSQWADFSRGKKPAGLAARIKRALELYPCDLLFIHRDAEKQEPERRVQEINDALAEIQQRPIPPAVCVVPVRMQEAWLLFDESAIRNAAGNPNGTTPLNLPPLSSVESIPDPKKMLYDMLQNACGLSGRRLKKFSPNSAAYSVTRYATDFTKLRQLSAFRQLEKDIDSLRKAGWKK